MAADEAGAGIIRLHWNSVAARWRHFGPPLRPCAEDIGVFRRLAAMHARVPASATGTALLLGMTPEIADMDWPWPCRLTAIDRSPEMVQIVWPGDIAERRRGFVREWLTPPAEGERYDAVIGDGCFISMGFPDGHRALARHVRRLLAPGGVFLIRLFLQPDRRERAADVLADLGQGRIGSFHAFKWRFAMALQESPESGVRLHDIWAAWDQARVDPASLPSGPGWTPEETSTIELYRDKAARFSFATRAGIEAVLADEFRVLESVTPGYELGERCPILALRAAGG